MSSRTVRTGLGFSLAAAAAIAFAWLLHAGASSSPIAASGEPFVASPGEVAPDVSPAVAPTPAGPAAPADPTPLRTAATPGRVAGVAKAGAGTPLTGWPVELRGSSPPKLASGRLELTRDVLGTRYTVTAADGTFEFLDAAPGDYEVLLVAAPGVSSHFALARYEEKWIELRGASVRVEAQLVRFGVPVANGRAAVTRKGEQANPCGADNQGVVHWLLEPGVYTVCTFNEAWSVATSTHTCVVPTGAAMTTWRLEVGGVDVQIDAAYADGTPCRSFGVRLDGTLATGERAARDFPGTAGTAMFARVPPGRWRVTVQAPDLAPVPSRELATDNGTPSEHLAFVVDRGATVRLVLRGCGDARFDVDPSLLPWLVSGDAALRCCVLQAAGRDAKARYGYVGVPRGPARLLVADRVADEGIEFLPFDPHAPIAIEVALDRDNEVVIDVLPRALVDLRGCDAGGREDPTARVSVFAGDRRVFGRESAAGQRWSGWLPPGDYRVQIDRKGAVREHMLSVARTDVTVRYRP